MHVGAIVTAISVAASLIWYIYKRVAEKPNIRLSILEQSRRIEYEVLEVTRTHFEITAQVTNSGSSVITITDVVLEVCIKGDKEHLEAKKFAPVRLDVGGVTNLNLVFWGREVPSDSQLECKLIIFDSQGNKASTSFLSSSLLS